MSTTKYFPSSSSSISSSFASVFLVSTLFAICCFSFLYLHYPHQLRLDDDDDHTIHYVNNKVSIHPPTISPSREANSSNIEGSYDEDRQTETYIPEPINFEQEVVNLTTPLMKNDEDEGEMKIFELRENSTMFEKRIEDFFQGCEVRFFMVWISSSSLFGNRELLSLESVFKAHPKGCVVVVSNTMDSSLGRDLLEPIVKTGHRVLPVAPDLSLLFVNSPAEPWLRARDQLDPSILPITENLSNLIRLVLLYKFGGIYLDPDIIILKNILSLRNCVGVQNVDENTQIFNSLGNAVLIFDQKHPLLLKFIEEFTTHFDRNIQEHNSRDLLTRVVVNFTHTDGYDFTIMSPTAFFPVSTTQLPKYFGTPKNENETQWTYDEDYILKRESYTVHFSNHISSKLKVEEHSLIGRLFSEHCIICKYVYDIDTPSFNVSLT